MVASPTPMPTRMVTGCDRLWRAVACCIATAASTASAADGKTAMS